MSEEAEHTLEERHTTMEAENLDNPLEDRWLVSNGPKDGSPDGDWKVGASNTTEAAFEVDVGGAPVTEALPFLGFVRTEFSTAERQYFYMESRENSQWGSGNFAEVLEVHWLNPESGQLEACMDKSLGVAKGQMHPRGFPGWQADAVGEVRTLRCLAGVPGVPAFLDMVVEPDGAIHIIMGRAPGVELSIRMGSFRGVACVGLSWQEMRCTLLHLAQVLADCHERGVVHGDIKPQNIMSGQEGCQVTLVDFGSASFWDGASWKYNGGTIAYTAPELLLAARSKRPADAAPCFTLHGPPVDLWAFGVTSLELLTGCCLFEPNTRARPSEMTPGSKECDLWDWRYTANLHGEWEENLESSPVVATFRRRMELLADASEEYKRAATDFLCGLLKPDPGKRMTAQDALIHPFLTENFLEIAPDLMPAEVEEDEFVIKNTMDRMLWEMCEKVCNEGYGTRVGVEDAWPLPKIWRLVSCNLQVQSPCGVP